VPSHAGGWRTHNSTVLSLHCAVLYCTVLYCAVLYCARAVLYCTVLYCTAAVLYCAVLCCTSISRIPEAQAEGGRHPGHAGGWSLRGSWL